VQISTQTNKRSISSWPGSFGNLEEEVLEIWKNICLKNYKNKLSEISLFDVYWFQPSICFNGILISKSCKFTFKTGSVFPLTRYFQNNGLEYLKSLIWQNCGFSTAPVVEQSLHSLLILHSLFLSCLNLLVFVHTISVWIVRSQKGPIGVIGLNWRSCCRFYWKTIIIDPSYLMPIVF